MVAHILTVLLAGFAFATTFHLTRYRIMRKQGYELLLMILLPGWLIQSVVIGAAEALALAGVPPVNANVAASANTIASIFMAWTIGALGNWRIAPFDAALFVAKASGDLMECILLEAWQSDDPVLVELVMESGKVYIGYPVDSGIDTLGESDVAVIPLMSGHRRAKSKRLKIDVYYHQVLVDAARSNRIMDFHIALPKRRIVSARRFDLEVYERAFGGSTLPPDLDNT